MNMSHANYKYDQKLYKEILLKIIRFITSLKAGYNFRCQK